MDFFAAQDRARRASRWLILLFALALGLSIGIIYLALIPAFTEGDNWWHLELFVVTALAVGGTILGASLLQIAQLAAGGGAAVAKAMGGGQVLRSTTENDEKRLLNLVDEMAIAAGVPVPQVFILDDENSINAFAAGKRPGEAAIALTRGALQQLSRDELQGVIAHEFSHILNGDMRLNMQLLGILHGLFVLAGAGRLLLRNGARSDRGRGALIALGIALVIAGYWGVLAGRLIRAAISRQREFLADAAAVQFTRNPEGISRALQRIANQKTHLQHPSAEEVSHMLLDGRGFARWLATHPPIEERIRRLRGASAPLPLAPLDQAQLTIQALPAGLHELATSPQPAQGILALLLADGGETRQRQLKLLEDALGPSRSNAIAQLPRPQSGQRLTILELAIPSLRSLRLDQRENFLHLVDQLVRADGRITLSEYITARLLRDNLLPRPATPPLLAPGELARHCALLLSLLTHTATQSQTEKITAFAHGARLAPVDGLHLQPIEALRTEALDAALSALSGTAPGYRKRLLDALSAVAMFDGRIQPREQELLTLIANALDCPLPPNNTATMPTTTSTPQAQALVNSAGSTDRSLLADRAPLQALLFANLIPVAGVLFFDWDARNVLLLYWLENLVIGGYTLLRMVVTHRWRAFGAAVFFSFHYSFFCGGHGFIVFGLSGLGTEGMDDPMGNYWPDDDGVPVFLMPLQMLIAILSWMANESPGMLGLPLLAFMISHGISAFTHHVILREDDGREVDAIMWDPYSRIFLLHIALLGGSFVIILSGGGGAWPILLLLIGLKTAFDIHQHRKTHEKRQQARQASSPSLDIESSDGGTD